MHLYKKLLNYCTWQDSTGKAIQLLNSNGDLDLAHNNGMVFRLAIKYDNVELLNALLDYYKAHKLSADRESIEYKQSLCELRKVLESAERGYKFSAKIAEVLSPYLPLEEDDNSSQDQDLSNADNWPDMQDFTPANEISNCDECQEHISSAISGADSFTLQHTDCT